MTTVQFVVAFCLGAIVAIFVEVLVSICTDFWHRL